MRRIFPPFTLYLWGAAFLLSIFFLPSCGGSTDPDEPPISGIVETNDIGAILQEDPADWLPRMVTSSGGGTVIVPDPTSEFFSVGPAFPNPASAKTRLQFALGEKAQVHIWVVDADGNRVQDVMEGDSLTAGQFMVDWNLRNSSGNRLVAPGLYRVRFLVRHGQNSTEERSFGDVQVE